MFWNPNFLVLLQDFWMETIVGKEIFKIIPQGEIQSFPLHACGGNKDKWDFADVHTCAYQFAV